jgi:hypothetical protein
MDFRYTQPEFCICTKTWVIAANHLPGSRSREALYRRYYKLVAATFFRLGQTECALCCWPSQNVPYPRIGGVPLLIAMNEPPHERGAASFVSCAARNRGV